MLNTDIHIDTDLSLRAQTEQYLTSYRNQKEYGIDEFDKIILDLKK